MAALRKHIEPVAPGLSPKAVLEQLGAIKRVDVCLPTSDGRWLVMPRHTEPEPEQLMLLEKLGMALPAQPPPHLRGEVADPPVRMTAGHQRKNLGLWWRPTVDFPRSGSKNEDRRSEVRKSG